MTEESLKMIVFSLFTGGGLLINSISRRKKTRKIADTPRSKVASAPQGYVELQGFAWPAAQYARSAAGDEIVYYSLEVQRAESRGSGKNRRREWVPVFTHGHIHPFYLVDPTGLALVDPASAEFDLHGSQTRNWTALKDDEKKWVGEIAARRAINGFPPGKGLLGVFSSSYRVIEKEIGVGSPLYLHGDFRTSTLQNPKVKAAGLSEFVSRIFSVEARSTKNISHFLDKNRDGVVCGDESRQGYGFAGRQARNKGRTQPREEREFEICGNVGSSPEHRLLIADAHEEHLVKRREKWIWIQFVGGAVLIAFGCTALSLELL